MGMTPPRVMLTLVLAMVPPVWVLAQTAAPASELAPVEPWLRAMLYVGSICLGGYLVYWLTREVWPKAFAAFQDKLAAITDALWDQTVEIKNSAEAQSREHAEQLQEMRTLHNDIRKLMGDRREQT